MAGAALSLPAMKPLPTTILAATLVAGATVPPASGDGWELEVRQVTHGPMHHFFGYIGHVQNIPWNRSNRYIVALRTTFHDRMPRPDEAAEIVLVDTRNGNRVTPIERTRAWNFQQGTMFYWNPEAPETQLFFNDRDVETNRVFTVLYDVESRRRVREFRFADTPAANGGVAQTGGRFLAINYGRLARLRPVTGYPGAYDWTGDAAAPADDGIFIVDVASGSKRLLVSFRELADRLRARRPDVARKALFINHTLWNRESDRIYFFVRADFDDRAQRIDVPCTIRPDGTGLTLHDQHIGGHPEWERGPRIIGDVGGDQIVYDVDRRAVVETLGSREIFPRPGGDVALSPDGRWLVNGYRIGDDNLYVVFRRSDGSYRRTRAFPHPGWTSGELRVDGSPAWNRTGDEILFPAIDAQGARQIYTIRIVTR